LWYSGKGRRFAGNVQVIATPDGTPPWVSDVPPGSVHDLAAARRLVPPAPHTAIRNGLRVLTDIGHTGAAGIILPVRKHPDLPQAPAADHQTYNTILRCIRAKGERAIAELKQRWRALQHVTPSPNRIGAIAQAALVLNDTWRP
jgi:hypothetical protein